MNKTILVTGGLGYIGSHTIVSLLSNNYNVICIDNLVNSNINVKDAICEITNKPFEYFNLDLTNYTQLLDTLKKREIDGIIHFAAYKAVGESVKEPLKYYENNLGSLLNILKLSRDLKINKLVFSSSCTVYGQAESMPVTESTPQKEAESPYGATKQMGERIIKDYCAASELKAIALRYFNPIGAHPSKLIGENPNGIPANLIPYVTQTALGQREILTVYGDDYSTPDGTAIRDYIDINDLADAHVKAIKAFDITNLKFDVINVGTGIGSSVLKILQIFEKVNGVKVNYQFGPRRPGDVVEAWADITKAKNVLNWEPKFTLEDSLKSAFEWTKSNTRISEE